jgi:hypothetical protein
LHVKLDKTFNKWVVANLELTHNHALIDTHQTFFIPSHRTVTEGEKAEIQSLYQTRIKQSQIYERLAHQAGGYNKLHFTKKDLYNYTYAYCQSQVGDGDANSALSFLQGIVSKEPDFYYAYKTDEDGHLECFLE